MNHNMIENMDICICLGKKSELVKFDVVIEEMYGLKNDYFTK